MCSKGKADSGEFSLCRWLAVMKRWSSVNLAASTLSMARQPCPSDSSAAFAAEGLSINALSNFSPMLAESEPLSSEVDLEQS